MSRYNNIITEIFLLWCTINFDFLPGLSGPCMTLILTKGDTGEGVIDDIRNLIGPPDVEQAKQESPERQDCV